MRFLFTMNMPTRQGHQVHQVIGEHPAKSLDELTEAMNADEFITVDEQYREAGGNGLFSAGRVTLNTAHIGKVKADT